MNLYTKYLDRGREIRLVNKVKVKNNRESIIMFFSSRVNPGVRLRYETNTIAE